MAVRTPSAQVTIFSDTTQESQRVANQLQAYLLGHHQPQINCAIIYYTDALELVSNLPQYLILVYSSSSQRTGQVDKVIDKSLEMILQRQMKSIVAVTTTPGDSPSTSIGLPEKWASIPVYNANDYPDKTLLAKDVLREAAYVKLPYSQEVSSSAGQSAQRATHGWGSKTPSLWLTIGIITMLLAVVGGTLFFVFSRPPRSNSLSSANPTATTQVNGSATAKKTKTAGTAVATPDAEQKARQQDLAKITSAKPTVSGFQTNDGWSNDGSKADRACANNNNVNYTVDIKQSAQYQPCLASALSYKNFALQVTMNINGDAGGVIFRSTNGKYYRLAYRTDTSTFNLVLCDKGTCPMSSISDGTVVGTPVNVVANKKSMLLAVVVQEKNIDVYADQKFVTRFTDDANEVAGQIGVYAADINTETSVTFSDLKIWPLDK
jgi:uncharacterized protein (UPF0333 family)